MAVEVLGYLVFSRGILGNGVEDVGYQRLGVRKI